MTMPSERTRSLRQALEFMKAVRTSGLLTPELRNQLEGVLRHYPDASQIAHMAMRQENPELLQMFEPDLLPEDYYDKPRTTPTP